MPPSQIGRYKILEFLGRGAMGQVYRAHDTSLNRQVALKLLALPDPAGSDEWRRRFRREAQAAARLNHPHIVIIYDVDLDHEPPYVVMELLTGYTLAEYLGHKPLPWPEALSIIQPLGQALAYAHQAGVVHRDVKPANVMFARVGQVGSLPYNLTEKADPVFHNGGRGALKLVDFGLARWQGGEQVSQTGAVIGTLAYMSPEQANGAVVDARSDIFALGIILFEALAGYNPLDQGSLPRTLKEVTSDKPVDLFPLLGKIPPGVIHLIERAVARERDQRYPTCEALLADLAHCLNDPTATASLPPALLPAAGVLPHTPTISIADGLHLNQAEQEVLRSMFSAFSRVVVEAEFGQGLSGSRVFRVRPVEAGDRVQLPAVVKIASTALIAQEWQAYESQVENTLPGIARLESPPTLPSGSLWGGLRYALVGGGTFAVESLHAYYYRADTPHLLRTLTERLFPIMGQNWWLDNRANRLFQMRADYDSLLPVNLLLTPATLPASSTSHLIEPAHLPWPAIATGEYVLLKGFVISEVDRSRRQLTLNLPSSLTDSPPFSYRLRLAEAPDIDQYRVGNLVDALPGLVKATRRDLLGAQAGQALGAAVDLAAERLILPGGLNLPNPLLAYQDILDAFLTVNISTIHGDLNLENILVDSNTGDVSLIDFATVRQGHALHDLLRLETKVVTKLIPAALAKANLSPETIHSFYKQLHAATAYPDRFISSKSPHPDLAKPMAMLMAIRRMAGKCLFNSDDWTEYYRGLTLYLLSALKFKNLDSAPKAKQVTFWAAATAVDLLARPVRPLQRSGLVISESRSFPPSVKRLGVLTAVILVAGLMAWFLLSRSSENKGPLATGSATAPATMTGQERVGSPGESSAQVEATGQEQGSIMTTSQSIAPKKSATLPANTPSAEVLTPTLTNTATSPPTPTPTTTSTPTHTPMVLIATATALLPQPTPTTTIATPAPPTVTQAPPLPAGQFTLLKPASLEEPTFGPTEFEWEWSGPVAENQGFEVRVWRDGEPPAGVHNAVQDNTNGAVKSLGNNRYRLVVNISGAFGVKGRSGEYHWTVVLVQIAPEYKELGIEASSGRLRYEASGGGGGGSSSSGDSSGSGSPPRD